MIILMDSNSRMKQKSKSILILAFAFLLEGTPLPSHGVEKATVDPLSLVEAVYTHPSQPYKGRMVIDTWNGSTTKAEEVNVYFTPPSSYRLEFLMADGNCDRVVLTAGDSQEIQLFEKGKMVKNFIMKNPPKLISREEGRRLLLQNYEVSVKEAPALAGRRPAWLMVLTPITSGKPQQEVLIDKKTRVVLEVKRYTPNEPNGYAIRMTQFDPNASLAKTVFMTAPVDQSPFKKEDIDAPEIAETERASSMALLQGGFSLESVDRFEIQGKPVRHMQYTDGLIPLSLFETTVPVQMPKNQNSQFTVGNPLQMGYADSGSSVYLWNKGKLYYTLIGDTQRILLQQIASRIE